MPKPLFKLKADDPAAANEIMEALRGVETQQLFQLMGALGIVHEQAEALPSFKDEIAAKVIEYLLMATDNLSKLVGIVAAERIQVDGQLKTDADYGRLQ